MSRAVPGTARSSVIGPGPVPSADLENAATALRRMAVRNAERQGVQGLDQVVGDLVRLGDKDAARAILERLAQAPDAEKSEVVFSLWSSGDRDTALRVVEALPTEARARGLIELACMAAAEGRPMLERGIEAALKTQDPISRGGTGVRGDMVRGFRARRV